MGGALGGLFGHGVHRILPQSSSSTGAYGLVGMAALTAAVTHAPLTSILLLFEMTGGYEVILPLMLSCISAVVVAQAISPDSAFTTIFTAAGIDVNMGRESTILRDLYVEDIMRDEPPTVKIDTRFRRHPRRIPHRAARLLVRRRRRGRAARRDHAARHQERTGPARPALGGDRRRRDAAGGRGRTAAGRSRARDRDPQPVEGSGDPGDRGRPDVGGSWEWINRADILELYNREVLHRDVLGIKLARTDGSDRDVVGLPSEYEVKVIEIPAPWANRTLAELDLRGRFGVHVLAIKQPGRRTAGRNELPDPSTALRSTQRLVVVGTHEDLARLEDDAGLA